MAKASSSSDIGKTGSSGSGYYKFPKSGGTLTISSASAYFNKIVITFAAQEYGPYKNNSNQWAENLTVSSGSITKTNETTFQWEGSATNSITFTNAGSSADFRIRTVAVTPDNSTTPIVTIAANHGGLETVTEGDQTFYLGKLETTHIYTLTPTVKETEKSTETITDKFDVTYKIIPYEGYANAGAIVEPDENNQNNLRAGHIPGRFYVVATATPKSGVTGYTACSTTVGFIVNNTFGNGDKQAEFTIDNFAWATTETGLNSSNGKLDRTLKGFEFTFTGGEGVKYNNGNQFVIIRENGHMGILENKTGLCTIYKVDLTYFTYGADQKAASITTNAIYNNDETVEAGYLPVSSEEKTVTIALKRSFFTFDVTNNADIFIKKIKIYYDDNDNKLSQEKITPTMSFAQSEYVVSKSSGTTSGPKLNSTPASLQVTYASNNTDVATVDAQTGKVTIVSTGEATITASFAGNNYFNSATDASYTLKVDDDVHINLSYEGDAIDVEGTEYPSLTLNSGGASGMLDLIVDPADWKQTVLQGVTYTWEPLSKANGESLSSKNLITIKTNGEVQTTNNTGRALITATYGDAKAQYVVNVVKPGKDPYFKYGNNVKFDYYDGGTYENPIVNSKGSETWTVSDESIATINKGVLTFVKPVNPGKVMVKAAFKDGTSIYYDFELIDNPNKFFVSNKMQPKVGEKVTSVNGITMTWGGFTDNFEAGTGHKYMQPGYEEGDSEKTDTYAKAKTDDSGFDERNYFYSAGSQDPRYESTDNKGNVRGWERMRVKTDYLSKSVITYGTYFKFEPKKDGLLTVNVLQTGSIQDIPGEEVRPDWWSHDLSAGVISGWNYKALYLTDERGLSVPATKKESHSYYQHPYIYPATDESGNTINDANGNALSVDQRNLLSLKPHITKYGVDGTELTKINSKTGEDEYPHAYVFTYGETFDNDGNKIEKESQAGKIKEEMLTAFGLATTTELTDEIYETYLKVGETVHIMENQNHGYWTLAKSNNEYTFQVKAGKTYFLFTDGSKLSLGSFEFKPTDADYTEVTIEGADKQDSKTEIGNTQQSNLKVTLNRKLIKNQPNSLMLPFSVSASMVKQVFGEGTQVLHVKSIGTNIQFARHHHQMIVAGEPCIIYPTNETASSWTFEGVTIEKKSLLDLYEEVGKDDEKMPFTFVGCFEKEDMPAGSYYVKTTSSGQTTNGQDIYIYQVSKDNWMSNTRAFFKIKPTNPQAKLMNATFENAIDESAIESETTAIRIVQSLDLPTTANSEGLYTISGQKVDGQSLQKGVYVVNGRKVVIK